MNKQYLNEILEIDEEFTRGDGTQYIKFAEGKIARVITEEELEELRLV